MSPNNGTARMFNDAPGMSGIENRPYRDPTISVTFSVNRETNA